MEALISVVVPVYNVGEYLKECIESIKSQTYKNLQIILVDDGSTDASKDICDYYATIDSRIEVIHQDNHGPTYARKVGIARARGEYIGFVDGDDTIDKDMYELLCHEIVNNNCDFVHSGYYEDALEKAALVDEVIENTDVNSDFLYNVVFGEAACISPSMWSKLFRTDFIKRCYEKVPNNITLGEDLINLCVCIMEAKRFVLMSQAFYHYRVRSNSLTHRKFTSMSRDYFFLYKALCDLFCEYGRFEELEDKLRKFLLNNLFGLLQYEDSDISSISKYCFIEVEKIKGKKIVIYGAGVVGKAFFSQIRSYDNCEIVAWVDKNPMDFPDVDIVVEKPEVLGNLDYDYILIALKDEERAFEVKHELYGKGVDLQKILWSVPKRIL